MTARLFANVVYAWLLSRAPDVETRERIDAALYEPLEGAERATENFFANLLAIGD